MLGATASLAGAIGAAMAGHADLAAHIRHTHPAAKPTVSVRLADRQVAVVARRAGCWRGGQLTTAVAVALAESGGRTGAQGDMGLHTGTWGPSVGLWQIRSLNAQHGTGGVRDAAANTDPQVNARHACVIWRAQGWGPWSTWRHGTYRGYLRRAQEAVAGGGK